MIHVTELKKTFGAEHALKGIDFEVAKGEVFGLLGPSGSGKTTTIKLLTGEFKSSGGSLEVNGTSDKHFGKTSYVKNLGILSDKTSLYDRLTVSDNLELYRKLYDAPKNVVDEVLGKVGLLEEKGKRVSKLSKGMKQRVMLCKAVLHKPDVLFLDEPTSALDPTTTEKIHEMLEELKNEGTTIMLTTHNMDEATRLCDRVAFLCEGVIKETGSPETLRHRYKKNEVHLTYEDGGVRTVGRELENQGFLKEALFDTSVIDIRTDFPTLGEVFKKVTGKELV
ncbi:MAG TPA: ABC transporter ATP-binding protein [Candidatus Salinicoccus merdavium]|nr:ABC transporter ATP-binding protein [Candidatus Salinicoccus merdavium]